MFIRKLKPRFFPAKGDVFSQERDFLFCAVAVYEKRVINSELLR